MASEAPQEVGDGQQQPQQQQDQQQITEIDKTSRRHAVPFFSKLSRASYLYAIKGITAPLIWFQEWREYFNPPDGRPNIVKSYECRPELPIRIFFPASYDQTSPQTLPTLFTIHGGGWCIGQSRDDDEWNRKFADGNNVLVIALNYAKAPGSPFPTAIYDLQALLLAALADESLPIDRTSNSARGRTAILGFSAGGNLTLAVCQLADIKNHVNCPLAAISVYGSLDLSLSVEEKLRNRPFKSGVELGQGDYLTGMAPAFEWGYIPEGQDLTDALLSPAFAERKDLPEFLGFVGCELDFLAHESWRAACRFSGKKVPDRESEDILERICGIEGVVKEVKGTDGLVLDDERYGFEEGGVKWLLVPDVVHGFDSVSARDFVGGGEETRRDAERKEGLEREELGRWLKEVVWKV
ncbi:Arylacetamide deacetylase [Podospora fimiseda]|uniref:Arylacetamide deacetylase n=1 Tax=Podospora fimiseda TaxID=252190 RepID=A0AAN7BIX1_9PEZI|nr:Arylacetamide deacetylase [Podospora fimiseda]